jgi:hypothetical protein
MSVASAEFTSAERKMFTITQKPLTQQIYGGR